MPSSIPVLQRASGFELNRTLNLRMLSAVATAAWQHGDLTLQVGLPGERRSLHIVAGHLVASQSDFLEDRIGEMLASEGRLDPALLQPLSTAARAQGKLFGAMLLEEGLISPAELGAALERQVFIRFERALLSNHAVSIEPRTPAPQLTRRHLAALVLELFRRLELPTLDPLVRAAGNRPLRLAIPGDPFAALGLLPAELRIARLLGSGRSVPAVLGEARSPESVVRLAAALLGLEVLQPA